MEENIALLQRVPLFRALDAAQLGPLANAARVCVYPQDSAIVEQGQRTQEAEDGDSLYLIIAGRVRVVRDRAGHEELLAHLGSGELFGETALFDGRPHLATVIAEEDTRCLVLARWDLLRVMRRNPEIGIQMLTAMGERLRGMQDLIA